MGGGGQGVEAAAAVRQEASRAIFLDDEAGDLGEALVMLTMSGLIWADTATIAFAIDAATSVLGAVCIAGQAGVRYHELVGGHVFAGVIRALLQDKPCAKTHQALLIQLVQRIYCRLCLGIQPVGDMAAAHATDCHGVVTSGVPRQVFADLCGASVEEIQALDERLLSTRSDKDHKATMKAFLRSLIPRATMGEGGAGGAGGVGVGGGDLLRKELPIIQDLGERLVVFSSRRFKRGAEAEQGGDEGIGLVALFGGE
jgi:hypothetical protein